MAMTTYLKNKTLDNQFRGEAILHQALFMLH